MSPISRPFLPNSLGCKCTPSCGGRRLWRRKKNKTQTRHQSSTPETFSRVSKRQALLGADSSVRPNASTHIAGAGGEVLAARAGRHRDDGVLMSLEHDLCVSGPGIPELDTAILGPRHHPGRVGGQGDGENKILDKKLAAFKGAIRIIRGAYSVTLKCLDTSASLGSLVHLALARGAKLPHLDGPVKTAAD